MRSIEDATPVSSVTCSVVARRRRGAPGLRSAGPVAGPRVPRQLDTPGRTPRSMNDEGVARARVRHANEFTRSSARDLAPVV
ncbi:hypothetical protein MTO96_027854 [Rhipicephalus appendiculatus]